jgi:mRNA-degrading endonuclease RelE of RelBE toxin-antitoxin system
MFEIYFRPRALKTLRKIKRNDQLKINRALENLKTGKFNLLNIRKLKGVQQGYRLRVGEWRILFSLFDKEKKDRDSRYFLERRRCRL